MSVICHPLTVLNPYFLKFKSEHDHISPSMLGSALGLQAFVLGPWLFTLESDDRGSRAIGGGGVHVKSVTVFGCQNILSELEALM